MILTDALLDEALKLPVAARAELAGRLLETLDDEEDDDAEELWAGEIARRVRELDEGKVKTVPWAEVRREMLARPAR
jgi:putative addiction module component (TIGR02574 family)